jgi:hypothetical protein
LSFPYAIASSFQVGRHGFLMNFAPNGYNNRASVVVLKWPKNTLSRRQVSELLPARPATPLSR